MLIDLYETNNIGELQLAKSLLRINEIEFDVQNEYILQTGSIEAMGIQGAVLKVHKGDYQKALDLLKENKLVLEGTTQEQESPFITWLDSNVNFSFFKGRPVYIKLLLLVGLLCLIIGSISYALLYI